MRRTQLAASVIASAAARIVHRDAAGGVDDGAAALARQPFERIAGQSLVGASLPHESPQPRCPRRALGALDARRRVGELRPGSRHRKAMARQQVAAVIQQPHIDEPGQRDQAAAHEVVGDELREELAAHGCRVGAQIDQVPGEDSGPDDVDLEDIEIRRAGGQQLLVERETLRAGVGRGHELHRVAGARRPVHCALAADLELAADGAAGDRDRHGMGSDGRHERQRGDDQAQTARHRGVLPAGSSASPAPSNTCTRSAGACSPRATPTRIGASASRRATTRPSRAPATSR